MFGVKYKNCLAPQAARKNNSNILITMSTRIWKRKSGPNSSRSMPNISWQSQFEVCWAEFGSAHAEFKNPKIEQLTVYIYTYIYIHIYICSYKQDRCKHCARVANDWRAAPEPLQSLRRSIVTVAIILRWIIWFTCQHCHIQSMQCMSVGTYICIHVLLSR